MPICLQQIYPSALTEREEIANEDWKLVCVHVTEDYSRPVGEWNGVALYLSS